MAKKKFYVVWQGKETGVFDSWDKCKRSIDGFSSAQYKSFASKEEAKFAFEGSYLEYKGAKSSTGFQSGSKTKLVGNAILDSISVDAACSGNPGLMEYQGVETASKKLIFKQGPFEEGTNNIGEFLALVHALAYMKKTGDSRPIYTDSKTAMSWIRLKKAKTTIQKSTRNQQIFELLERAETWLHTNQIQNQIIKWETKSWGEIPADFGRK